MMPLTGLQAEVISTPKKTSNKEKNSEICKKYHKYFSLDALLIDNLADLY